MFGLALMASCTQETGIEPAVEGQDLITLGVSNGPATRAAINDLEGLAAAPNVGIYAQTTTATTANTSITAEWTAAPLMKNVQTTAIDATTGKMSWATPVYYPKTAPMNVKFFAYYPYAAEGTTGKNYVTAPAAATPPELTFELSGEEDLMWATPSMGSRMQPAGALKFNHQLTQFTVKLIDADKTFEGSITSVTITANTTGKMNLETGATSNWSGNKSLIISSNTFDTKTLENGEVTLPKVMMLQAGLESYDMTIMTTVGSKATTVRPAGDKTFVAGKAYLITVRLSGNVPIAAYAEVVPWVTGGTGEGVVE